MWVNSVKDTTSRLLRWRLKLAEYDYRVTYKTGKTNLNADALSRNPVPVLPFSTASDSSDSAIFDSVRRSTPPFQSANGETPRIPSQRPSLPPDHTNTRPTSRSPTPIPLTPLLPSRHYHTAFLHRHKITPPHLPRPTRSSLRPTTWPSRHCRRTAATRISSTRQRYP